MRGCGSQSRDGFTWDWRSNGLEILMAFKKGANFTFWSELRNYEHSHLGATREAI